MNAKLRSPRPAALFCLALLIPEIQTEAQKANKPSFESDSFKVSPGYLRDNVLSSDAVAPEITRQPTSQKAVAGNPGFLQVLATGSEPLSYQWKRNGTNLLGQLDPTLTFSQVTAEDSGLYSVMVSNTAGQVLSDSAALCVCLRGVSGIVFGTGLGATGTPLTNGATDAHYILAASSDPAYPGPDAIVVNDDAFPIPPWLATSSTSKWIAPRAEQVVGNLPGVYSYWTFFDLTGIDPTQFRIDGQWAVDDVGISLMINGNESGITAGGSGAFTPFAISQNFVDGVNQLEFQVTNGGGAANPTGLRVELNGLVTIQPAMAISRSGTNLSISWTPTSPCMQLQSADHLAGPWSTITEAAVPYTVPLSDAEAARFYKVVQ
jgi:hypothetical protein